VVVNAGKNDFCDELNSWGAVGIVEAAVDLDAVDAVLVDGLWWHSEVVVSG
jgi:hypothetical protein